MGNHAQVSFINNLSLGVFTEGRGKGERKKGFLRGGKGRGERGNVEIF
jgi:hypothetical protein